MAIISYAWVFIILCEGSILPQIFINKFFINSDLNLTQNQILTLRLTPNRILTQILIYRLLKTG